MAPSSPPGLVPVQSCSSFKLGKVCLQQQHPSRRRPRRRWRAVAVAPQWSVRVAVAAWAGWTCSLRMGLISSWTALDVRQASARSQTLFRFHSKLLNRDPGGLLGSIRPELYHSTPGRSRSSVITTVASSKTSRRRPAEQDEHAWPSTLSLACSFAAYCCIVRTTFEPQCRSSRRHSWRVWPISCAESGDVAAAHGQRFRHRPGLWTTTTTAR